MNKVAEIADSEKSKRLKYKEILKEIMLQDDFINHLIDVFEYDVERIIRNSLYNNYDKKNEIRLYFSLSNPNDTNIKYPNLMIDLNEAFIRKCFKFRYFVRREYRKYNLKSILPDISFRNVINFRQFEEVVIEETNLLTKLELEFKKKGYNTQVEYDKYPSLLLGWDNSGYEDEKK